jgi:hypothetical protein
MNRQVFDGVARGIGAAQDRRTSLKAIGATALLAVGATPARASAKKDSGKKAAKRCKRQVGQCKDVLQALCDASEGQQECLDDTARCCSFLGDCKGGEAVECIIGLFTKM